MDKGKLFVVFCLILAERAPAQTAKPTSEKKTSVETAPEPEDPFGRSTPRSCVAAFLKAFHRENDERAAQYLDSSLELPEREELAYNLGVILDRKLSASLSALSEKPEGNPTMVLRHTGISLASYLASRAMWIFC